jgi:hypothetical protein
MFSKNTSDFHIVLIEKQLYLQISIKDTTTTDSNPVYICNPLMSLQQQQKTVNIK